MSETYLWIWSTNETPSRGSGLRRVLVKPGTTQRTRRLYDPRNPDGHPDVVTVETLERIRYERKEP